VKHFRELPALRQQFPEMLHPPPALDGQMVLAVTGE
jgi:hypothetical protein